MGKLPLCTGWRVNDAFFGPLFIHNGYKKQHDSIKVCTKNHMIDHPASILLKFSAFYFRGDQCDRRRTFIFRYVRPLVLFSLPLNIFTLSRMVKNVALMTSADAPFAFVATPQKRRFSLRILNSNFTNILRKSLQNNARFPK